VSDYARHAEELTAALEAFESTRDALHEIPEEHARLLADADPDALAILSREGLVREPASNGSWTPDALEPAPFDPESDGSESDRTDVWSTR